MPYGCIYSILAMLRGADERSHGRANGCIGFVMIVVGIIVAFIAGFPGFALIVFGILIMLFGTGTAQEQEHTTSTDIPSRKQSQHEATQWTCVCGEANFSGESKCWICGEPRRNK